MSHAVKSEQLTARSTNHCALPLRVRPESRVKACDQTAAAASTTTCRRAACYHLHTRAISEGAQSIKQLACRM